ncbi:MAG TPA: TonB-dependent receptor, partial [Opitutus sp.]|nr:TonB-dependent receptor [Opitutus sp.]
YSKLRSLNITPATLIPFIFENDLEGETYGVELAGTVELTDGWRLHAGYNLLKEDLRVVPGGFDVNDTLNETADPQHQVSIRSSFDLPGNVEFDAGFRWVDAFTINNGGNPATVSSYAELDLRLGWRVNDKVELSVVGQNLLHDRHAEYGAPSPLRVEIQRSVYAKLAWRY